MKPVPSYTCGLITIVSGFQSPLSADCVVSDIKRTRRDTLPYHDPSQIDGELGGLPLNLRLVSLEFFSLPGGLQLPDLYR